MTPLRIVGGRTAASGAFRLELDQKDFAKGRKLVDRYRGASLRKRMEVATLAAAKVLETPMRQAAPVNRKDDGHRGQLRSRTRARQARQRYGIAGFGATYANSVNALVGPTVPYRHLVIRGHRIVTRGGRDTGRRSRPNPYVDVVAARLAPRAIAEMRRYIFDGRTT